MSPTLGVQNLCFCKSRKINKGVPCSRKLDFRRCKKETSVRFRILLANFSRYINLVISQGTGFGLMVPIKTRPLKGLTICMF